MAKILKGIEVADAINIKLAAEVKALRERSIIPVLAVLRVGEAPDQVSYVRSVTKRCQAADVAMKDIVLAQDANEETVIAAVKKLNDDCGVHGVLILRPLPGHISDDSVRAALLPQKDVDGITDTSLAGVFSSTDTGFAPCTAEACMEILSHYKIDCAGKRAVVIGRSLVVGKPAAIMLMDRNATVTVCHTRTVDIPAIARSADIVIVAAGRARMLTGEYFSPGQVVIDVGINWVPEEEKLCGDVKFADAVPIVAAITPVPGGVGTVTAAVLVSHTVSAAKRLKKGW